MLAMATPPHKADSDTTPQKRVRVGYSLNVWVSDEHGAVFEELLRRSRRTKTAEVELMIEQIAGQAGLWPPVPDEADPKKKPGKGGK